jgi:hypothetical protein
LSNIIIPAKALYDKKMSWKELHKPLGFQSQANLLTYLLFSNSCNEEKIKTGRVNCMEKEMQARKKNP